MGRLVPLADLLRWFDTPDFFDPQAAWRAEWQGMTPTAAAPAGLGLVALDMPGRWLGYALWGVSPFRWAWSPEEANLPRPLLQQALSEGRLDLNVRARRAGPFAREAERTAPLPSTADALESVVLATQATFLAQLCADGSSQPGEWCLSAQVRLVPPPGWSCESFFRKGAHADGDWLSFAQALVGRGWDFSEVERVSWRRHLAKNGVHPPSLLDDLLAARAG